MISVQQKIRQMHDLDSIDIAGGQSDHSAAESVSVLVFFSAREFRRKIESLLTSAPVGSKLNPTSDPAVLLPQNRYYDPATGRFINADSYASTDATGLLSTKKDGGTTTHSYTYGNCKGGQYEYQLHPRYGRCSQQQDRGLDEV